jgi:hypothetical protein
MRNIHYVNNRQWIEYIRRTNEWRDVRLAKWFPKPVTNKLAEGVQALRAMFSSGQHRRQRAAGRCGPEECRRCACRG